MPFALYTDLETLAHQAVTFHRAGAVVVLTAGDDGVARQLRPRLPDPERLISVDVRSDRLGRINFDAVAYVVLDLSSADLLSSAGRRLVDALGRLAEEELVLCFVGDAVAATGACLADGVTAGLNRIRHTVVLIDLARLHNLHDLLLVVRDAGLRILACDGSVSATYDLGADSVTVYGSGSVLLGALSATTRGEEPKVRLQVLTDGMTSRWPA